eukprot:CAMPEP_0169404150 /NCGR_PEP_ID=MMETSP1017-20121227/56183_1 /TAXON_ID=342587 /ORGANISM="Karlodinium micrum, Strain CCMP2283" /LENGTH=56 /DNA_ID=CAMNT_0009510507 /DNA_START=137 /DNA_END=307 /DNA_ORIENTATION=-
MYVIPAAGPTWFFLGAPTAKYLPEVPMEFPNLSPNMVSVSTTLPCALQLPPARENM